MIFDQQTLFDLAHDHYHLVTNVLPTPNTFMVQIVGLDEGLIGHAQKRKFPLITRRKSSETLQLSERDTRVVTIEISCNNCLAKFLVCGEPIVVILDVSYPFTHSISKVQRASVSLEGLVDLPFIISQRENGCQRKNGGLLVPFFGPIQQTHSLKITACTTGGTIFIFLQILLNSAMLVTIEPYII